MRLSGIISPVAVVLIALTSAVAISGLLPATPALAASCGTGGTTWQLGTESGNVSVLDTADSWNGGNACLTIGANGVDFTVQSQTINTSNLNPVAFPDTNLGCEGGFCTSTANQRQALPAVWSNLTPKVTGTWSGFNGTTSSTTKYDLLVDNEFSADCNGSDKKPSMDTAVSIYLDAVKNGVHGSYTALGLADANSGPTFTDSDGKVWYTKQTVNSSGIHNTEFSAKVPVSSITSKAMLQFYTWASSHGTGFMPPNDCLRDLGVGYEPWTQLKASTLGMSGVLLDP